MSRPGVYALVGSTTLQQRRGHGRTETVTTLGAVTVVAESDRHFTITPIRIHTNTNTRTPTTTTTAWPRRLVKKVLRRDNSSPISSKDGQLSRHRPRNKPIKSTDSFLLDGFAVVEPSKVFKAHDWEQQQRLNSNLFTVEEALGGGSAAARSSSSSWLVPESPPSRSFSEVAVAPLARVTASRAETILATLFHRWTHGAHQNLQVHCDSSSGVIDMVKGIFRADATIQFDKLSFGAFRLSRGELKSHRLALNLYKYAPFGKSIPRFSSMFDLEARDATFTQADLLESTCIRQGLLRLLTRCLQNCGIMSSSSSPDENNVVAITGIQIGSNGKLSILGSVTTPFGNGSQLEFAVRSGLDVTNRGHVLTFPGLEISLSPWMGLFVPVVPPISLDLGHNAQITKLHLNGRNKTLELSCRVTITPRHTRKLSESYEQDRNAYAASFHFDVGRWLTQLGRFSE